MAGLEQRLSWPDGWIDGDSCRARLVLSWWAEQMRLWVDGVLVHEGDLFVRLPLAFAPAIARGLHSIWCWSSQPTARRWRSDQQPLRSRAATGRSGFGGHIAACSLDLHLAAAGDLPPQWADLIPAVEAQVAVATLLSQAATPRGSLHWLGHAHLDLAWLWPVADTWQAAERTRSALDLMRRWPELRFAHSTPALMPDGATSPGSVCGDSGGQPRRPLGTDQWSLGGDGLCSGQHGVVVEPPRLVRTTAGAAFRNGPMSWPGCRTASAFCRLACGGGSHRCALVLHPQAGLECRKPFPPPFVSLARTGTIRTAQPDVAADRASS